MRASTGRLLAAALAVILGLCGCPARKAHDEHNHGSASASPARKGPVTYAELGVQPYPGSKPWGKQPSMRFVHDDVQACTLMCRAITAMADMERHFTSQLTDVVRTPTSDGCKLKGRNRAKQETTVQLLDERGKATRAAITVIF
ncbi:MAG: hypothetical protein NT029_00480 [Armatimonadetes bacterium]|nr:hypothetical protein [Armatimonadota bacterium]